MIALGDSANEDYLIEYCWWRVMMEPIRVRRLPGPLVRGWGWTGPWAALIWIFPRNWGSSTWFSAQNLLLPNPQTPVNRCLRRALPSYWVRSFLRFPSCKHPHKGFLLLAAATQYTSSKYIATQLSCKSRHNFPPDSRLVCVYELHHSTIPWNRIH